MRVIVSGTGCNWDRHRNVYLCLLMKMLFFLKSVVCMCVCVCVCVFYYISLQGSDVPVTVTDMGYLIEIEVPKVPTKPSICSSTAAALVGQCG